MANIELDGTNKKIKVDSGDLTLDVPGDIILDADGANVTFKDGGTSVLDLSNSSTDAVLTVSTQDKDLIIKGDDGGAAITATTFDMSDAGTLVLNHDLKVADNGQVGSASAADAMIISSGGIVTFKDDILIKDGGTIGSASDADAIAIAANGVVTFSQNPVFPDGGVAVADLDIDGATDIGAAIVDADLFIVDDGAGGTNRKTTASRLKTYIGSPGLTKLADVTITDGDASEQIDGCFSDDYESYLIQCLGFGVNAEAIVYVQGVYSTNTVISSGYYHIARGHNEDGDAGTDTGSNTSQGEIFGTSLLASEWNFANIWYHRPASVGSFKQRLFGNCSHIRHSGSKLHAGYFGIGIDNTNKLTGLKFSTSTSTYKQGQVIVWGYST